MKLSPVLSAAAAVTCASASSSAAFAPPSPSSSASSSSAAFTPSPSRVRAFVPPSLRSAVGESPTSPSPSDFASAVPEEPSAYDRLGVREDELALGIDAEDVLKWLGTRDDLIAKFQRDNKGMDIDRASSEVDKFLMDAEMVDAFIKYERRKAEGTGVSLREEAEQNFSDPSLWGTYAAWIGGGAGFAVVKNLVIEPKYASGEWTDVHVAIPFSDRVGDLFHHAADPVVAATADAASHSVDPTAVQSTVEGVAAVVSDTVGKAAACAGAACP